MESYRGKGIHSAQTREIRVSALLIQCLFCFSTFAKLTAEKNLGNENILFSDTRNPDEVRLDLDFEFDDDNDNGRFRSIISAPQLCMNTSLFTLGLSWRRFLVRLARLDE